MTHIATRVYVMFRELPPPPELVKRDACTVQY